MPRRVFLPTAVVLTWTLFVWVGRVRNALSDETLVGDERTGPLLLSLSFVLPAVVLAVVLVLDARRRTPAGAGLRYGVWALAAWTIGVWVVRVVDIAVLSDHEAPFIIVHVVLGAVSIAAAAFAARAVSPGQDSGAAPEIGAPVDATRVR